MPFRGTGQQRMGGLPRRSLGLAPVHKTLAQRNKRQQSDRCDLRRQAGVLKAQQVRR